MKLYSKVTRSHKTKTAVRNLTAVFKDIKLTLLLEFNFLFSRLSLIVKSLRFLLLAILFKVLNSGILLSVIITLFWWYLSTLMNEGLQYDKAIHAFVQG